MEFARELPDRLNNYISPRVGLWNASKPILTPLVAAKLPVFTIVISCWFSRFPWSFREEDGTGVSQNATKLAALTEIQTFFLNECSLDCCKSLVNFLSSEKSLFCLYLPVFSLFLWRRGYFISEVLLLIFSIMSVSCLGILNNEINLWSNSTYYIICKWKDPFLFFSLSWCSSVVPFHHSPAPPLEREKRRAKDIKLTLIFPFSWVALVKNFMKIELSLMTKWEIRIIFICNFLCCHHIF